MHQTIRTGQYVPGCRTHAKFVRAELSDGVWRVLVGVPTMTLSELERFRAGRVRMAAEIFGEALFFLFQFGDAPWERAPFEPRVCAREFAAEAPAVQTEFLFVDSDTGVAQERRVLTLPEAAAAHVFRLCRSGLDTPYDRAESQKKIAAAQRQFPTAGDMLQTVENTHIFDIST